MSKNKPQNHLVELFQQFSPDEVSWQFIGPSMVSCESHKKLGTKITFATDAATADQIIRQTGKVGMVVWMERAAATRVMEAQKAAHHE